MCGICGFYDYEFLEQADKCVLAGMLQVIHHRGPDDSGIHVDRELAIGMRRLSIIDVGGGKQPISNEDGSVLTVFNGEIYNFQILRDRLQSRGHTFKTASDTEVIPHLYEDEGENCLQQLRGMFGLAIWDSMRRRLFLARDRLGIKPLYFADVSGRLIFASEIKAILQHPAVKVSLNCKALSNYLSLKYVPAPQTMFEGIHALPPGCCLSCDAGGVRIRRYWDLSFSRSPQNGIREEAYAEHLAAHLRESVKLHLASDVPFGAFLSGGLDSSTIVALMTEFLNEPVKTYSVGFDGGAEVFTELPYARLVAKTFQTQHHEVLIGPSDLVNRLETVVWHLDQPVADEASLANYMVADLASRDVKMVLTGEGGDELFAGYARYAGERLSPLFDCLPRVSKTLALAACARIPKLRRQKLALYALCQSGEVTRFLNWFPLFNSEQKQELLASDFRASLDGYDAGTILAENLARTDAREPLNRMLYLDTKLWLPDDLLARGDKTSMAVSLEARVPLLDHKLVEFAATLPTHLKLRALARKYLLKKVSRAWLPAEVINRKKKGFPVPFSLWFRKQANEFLRDALARETIRRRGLFNPAFVERLLSEHERGFANHGSLLYGLLVFELWQRQFMDSQVHDTRTAQAVAD